MKTAISFDDLRKNLTDVAGRVIYADDVVVIRKYNREDNGMVLMSEREYEYLKDPAKRFTQAEWKKKFEVSDKIKARISDKDQDALEEAIGRAVKEVRAENQQTA